MLGNFRTDISHSVPYITHIYLCSFNSPTREEIYRGLKRKFQMAELITGRELCDLFRIEYDSVVKHRQKDQRANLEYIAHELLAIDGIKEVVLKSMRECGSALLPSEDSLMSDSMATPPRSTSTITPPPAG
jgi:hypothetical protein